MGVRVVVVVVAGLMGTHSAVGQNTGPGGVGNSSGTSSLVVWLSIDKGVTVHNGTDRIYRVKDMSGYNYGTVASSSDASSSPTSVRNALNGLSVARFDGVDDFLEVSDNPTIDLTQWSFFIVLKENSSKNSNPFFSKGILYPNFKLLSSNGQSIVSSVSYRDNTSSNDRYGIPPGPGGSSSFSIYQYDYDNVNLSHYRNLILTFTKAENRIPRVNEFPLYLGRDREDNFGYLGGDIAEFLVYNRKVNLTEQILITNHLAARYGLTLPKASEVYSMDDPANGDYDYDVAGIGQASDGSSQRNASGPDIVRVAVENPLTMVNGEFFMWGHKDNTEINSHILAGEGDVDGKIIQERLRRVWRVSEVGDVGSTTLSFDLTNLFTPPASNLRLMIDRDGDGFADNDVTPQGGGTYAGRVITFSKVNLKNGDRFTLGNTDRTRPLPIELLSFTATPEDTSVKVAWSTASETNHDYFIVQHSVDGETWEDVLKERGAGDKSTRTDYEGTDNRPHQGTSYYRLKQVDRDGKYSYSQIRRVVVAEKLVLKIYPNPVTSGSFLVVRGFEIEPENIQLVGMMGEHVPLKIFKEDEEVVLVEPINASPGVYILHVTKGYWKQSMRVVMR